MIAKINRFIRKLSIPINIFNILIGLLIGIAHVYLPFTSILGLVLGILMALSGSVSMGISYWFTSKNTAAPQVANEEERPPLENTPESKAFLAMAVPMLLLNTASSFFGMYTGTLLLAAALSFAISPPATIAIALVLSSFLALGTLLNSWLQTHYIWETLKKPARPQEASLERPALNIGNTLAQECTLKAAPSPKQQSCSQEVENLSFVQRIRRFGCCFYAPRWPGEQEERVELGCEVDAQRVGVYRVD